ncbi:MAG: tRNA (N6-threonylcarbamoyladenosine(37)-N6)-methyltransferase TrmO [Chloroflexota bacterium]|nr:tRNA (N6-threonylcarbamoyladenosine(37)-N6)-methyltransferase TrmO [Chloroflexota bacterium]
MSSNEKILEYIMRPIGMIHSPFIDKGKTPIQPTRSTTIGTVEVYPEFVDGLQDIDGFSHIILLYVFHRSSGYSLKVKPYLDDQFHGLFTTRYPERPNPIGLSIVRLLGRKGNSLSIEGVDVLDGTPLLDIKPFVPDFDIQTNHSTGWYDNRSKK